MILPAPVMALIARFGLPVSDGGFILPKRLERALLRLMRPRVRIKPMCRVVTR